MQQAGLSGLAGISFPGKDSEHKKFLLYVTFHLCGDCKEGANSTCITFRWLKKSVRLVQNLWQGGTLQISHPFGTSQRSPEQPSGYLQCPVDAGIGFQHCVAGGLGAAGGVSKEDSNFKAETS